MLCPVASKGTIANGVDKDEICIPGLHCLPQRFRMNLTFFCISSGSSSFFYHIRNIMQPKYFENFEQLHQDKIMP